MRGFGPEILSYLMRVSGAEDAAREIYSQFCEDLWKGIPRFEGRSQFRTWCYRLAQHARARHFDRSHRRREVHVATDQFLAAADQVRSETLWFLRTESKDKLSRVREALDEQARELLILRVDRGMSWNEIAAILLEPGSEEDLRRGAATLRMRYDRVKARIRKMMGDPSLQD